MFSRPGLVSYGSPLGLVHIAGEESTQDGEVFDSLMDKLPTILGGNTAVIRAVDGLQFATRDALLAYRSGVTTGVTAPCSSGLLAGLSTAFNTGAAHKLIEGAVVQDEVALHVSLSLSSSVSVSTQIATLRRLFLGGGAKGELEAQVTKVLEVRKADFVREHFLANASVRWHRGRYHWLLASIVQISWLR